MTQKRMKGLAANCPECKNRIQLKTRLSTGQFIICPNCFIELEVVRSHPLVLEVSYGDEFEEPIDTDDGQYSVKDDHDLAYRQYYDE